MFDKAIKELFENEGYYSNDPRDSGGETIFGITKRWYPNDFTKIYNVCMSGDTKTGLELATEFYKRTFWNPLYEELGEKLGIKLFDLSVNIGQKKLVRILQETLKLDFDKDVGVDGKLGLQTISKYKEIKYKPSVYSAFIFRMSKYYESLDDPTYFLGWLNRLYK